jgi:hypothetical protein
VLEVRVRVDFVSTEYRISYLIIALYVKSWCIKSCTVFTTSIIIMYIVEVHR